MPCETNASPSPDGEILEEDPQNPVNVVHYNKYKSYIYMSDKVKCYNFSLGKGMKWYINGV